MRILFAIPLLFVAACEVENGQNNQAQDDDQVENATEDIGNAAEDVGEEIENAAEDVGNEVENATE